MVQARVVDGGHARFLHVGDGLAVHPAHLATAHLGAAEQFDAMLGHLKQNGMLRSYAEDEELQVRVIRRGRTQELSGTLR